MHDFDIRIVFQICGAVLAITNYLLVQTHRIKATSPVSLGVVLTACSILLTSAIIGRDWGLILLEGTWLVMGSVTIAVRQRSAARRAVLEREALASAVPVRVVAAERAVSGRVVSEAAFVETVALERPVARELELAAAA
ncbi:hypothetical protein [Glycomyces harbinensis]|uniref:CBU-0592-like domain-containing protein n=1 Tax=Glycomyces harbinensis TaxID=58114 RepID=A0A1G6R9X2_9ACTN|nr:hypothetical protein [Glycomyces harbinensis]SDD01422.1 hypothetical protein SAMN05216270_101385 [Glycomyces harbinensis]